MEKNDPTGSTARHTGSNNDDGKRANASVFPKNTSLTKEEYSSHKGSSTKYYPTPEKVDWASLGTSNVKVAGFSSPEKQPKSKKDNIANDDTISTANQPGATSYGGSDDDRNIDSSSRADVDFLVEASLVEESQPPESPVLTPDMNLVAAEAVQPLPTKRRRLAQMVVLGGLLVLVGGVIAGVRFGVVFTPDNDNSPIPFNANSALVDISSSPSLSPTMSPTIELGPRDIVEQLMLLLPDFSARAIAEHPTGPQAHAFQWLTLNDNFASYAHNGTLLQRFAMATLYFATDGPSWTNNTGWLSDTDDCSWFGAPSAGPCFEGKRMILNLEANNLVGMLPPEIGLLSDLRALALTANQFVGELPSEIGRLTNMQKLILYNNQWTGTIPVTIGLMTELKLIDMDNSAFTCKFVVVVVLFSFASTNLRASFANTILLFIMLMRLQQLFPPKLGCWGS